jgi:EmrB/QacA subfamily drug resistance transporter
VNSGALRDRSDEGDGMTTTIPATHSPEGASPMTHREVLVSISGIMLAMLTTILSNTVVGTSLPVIVHDLGGGQSAYTWVVTASLLAMTVSTPLWGKFADLFNRKLLVQVALVIFVVGSVLGGSSQESWHLIAMRVLQGVGAGGLMSLSMVLISDIISPRDRGRYVGVLAGSMSIGTLGGPLLGGVITDLVGWRWNFYVAVPLALAAFVVLQRTLHLSYRPARRVRIDYLGAFLIAAGVGLLLAWVSLAGQAFPWWSVQTAVMSTVSLLVLAAAVRVQARAAEPLIPLTLFHNRIITLAILASVTVGMAMFGAIIFLAQYMQIARDKTPTESGLLTMPLMVASLVASTVIGQLVSRTGRYKPLMLWGAVALLAGTALMSTIDEHTSFVVLGIYMSLIGIGMGALMQNLVLVAQNTADVRQIGVVTSTVTFFRTLGGAAGVSVLGAVLGNRVSTLIGDGLARLGVDPRGMPAGSVPDPSTMPGPVRSVVEAAYAQGVADLFLTAVPAAASRSLSSRYSPNTGSAPRAASSSGWSSPSGCEHAGRRFAAAPGQRRSCGPCPSHPQPVRRPLPRTAPRPPALATDPPAGAAASGESCVRR